MRQQAAGAAGAGVAAGSAGAAGGASGTDATSCARAPDAIAARAIANNVDFTRSPRNRSPAKARAQAVGSQTSPVAIWNLRRGFSPRQEGIFPAARGEHDLSFTSPRADPCYGSAVTDSLTLIDMFVRGIAVGALIILAFSHPRETMTRMTRVVIPLTSLSIICWLITESHSLWRAFGAAYALMIPAFVVGGMFWLFVMTVFDDRPRGAILWVPAALLLVTGFLCDALPSPAQGWLWAARNLFSGALAVHAGVVIARGWSGDLLEARRLARAVVLGVIALSAVANVLLAFIGRIDPRGPWQDFTAGHLAGGGIFATLIVASAIVFLQPRPALFGASRRTAPVADARAEAAERLMLEKLNDLMAAGGWRREGLTIGELAGQLGEPEHRLRRLINRRLGHRNFADFVNSYRIEAAKQRLADPQEARTTVAAIAFDLGYGSLGPFNRAFRAATGVSPTEWRSQALQASPELQEAV